MAEVYRRALTASGRTQRPQFYKRVSRDARARDSAGKPTRCLIVHAVLIGISLVLAVVSAIVAIVALTTH